MFRQRTLPIDVPAAGAPPRSCCLTSPFHLPPPPTPHPPPLCTIRSVVYDECRRRVYVADREFNRVHAFERGTGAYLGETPPPSARLSKPVLEPVASWRARVFAPLPSCYGQTRSLQQTRVFACHLFLLQHRRAMGASLPACPGACLERHIIKTLVCAPLVPAGEWELGAEYGAPYSLAIGPYGIVLVLTWQREEGRTWVVSLKSEVGAVLRCAVAVHAP